MEWLVSPITTRVVTLVAESGALSRQLRSPANKVGYNRQRAAQAKGLAYWLGNFVRSDKVAGLGNRTEVGFQLEAGS
jgi:hypothetical protein